MSQVLDKLLVTIGVKGEGFDGVKGQIQGFTKGVQSDLSHLKAAIAGYFTADVLKQVVTSVTEMASRFRDLSEQTGVDTDNIQKYDRAFRKVGLSAEIAARGFNVLTQKRKEALEKGGKAAEWFTAFGIGEKELEGLGDAAKLAERVAGAASSMGGVKAREMFLEEFGTKIGGKMLAGFKALAAGEGEGSLMPKEDIERLHEIATQWQEATKDFIIKAGPLVADIAKWLMVAMNYWGKKLEDSPSGNKQSLELYDKAAAIGADKYGLQYDAATHKKASELMKVLGRDDPASGLFGGPLRDSVATLTPAELDKWRKEMGITSINPRAGELNSVEMFPGMEPSDPHTRNMMYGLKDALRPGIGPYSADMKAFKEATDKAALDAGLKTGNKATKRADLSKRIDDLMNAADAETSPEKKAKLYEEAFKYGGEFDKMGQGKSGGRTVDSMAAQGVFSGGSAVGSFNETLTVQQDMLSAVQMIADVVREYQSRNSASSNQNQ